MIQFQDRRPDIYQVLSFCLGYLKRKIVILLKISIDEKNHTSRPELISQLAKQQIAGEHYVQMLKRTQQKYIKQLDETLFQRFVCRIKQVVRNCLSHAGISHQLLVFIKKIQACSFKRNCRLQDYVVYILEQNPLSVQDQLSHQIIQLKRQNYQKEKSPKRYSLTNQLQSLRNQLSSRQAKKASLYNSKTYSKNESPQLTSEGSSLNKAPHSQTNRPVDIFNKKIKPIIDCMDCDISTIRGIYFNIQRQKQSCSLNRNNNDTFSNTNKIIRDVQQQMLHQNRYVRDSVKAFDHDHARHLTRLLKDPQYYIRNRKRVQTAGAVKKQFNFNILSSSNRQQSATNRPRKQITKKYNTINNNTHDQQRQQLYKQIQSRKSNVLKMTSISVSSNKGHLQLCFQNKSQNRKGLVTFANLRKNIQRNNKTAVVNLKKRYQLFIGTCEQVKNRQQINSNPPSTINIDKNNQETLFSNKTITSKIQCQSKQKRIDTPIKHQNFINDFEVTIKNFMKATSVNPNNFKNSHYKEKKMFQTINPQLTIKTIRKD